MQVRAEERKMKKRLIPYRLLSCILSSPKQLHAGPKFVYVSIVDRLSKWHWLFLSLYLWLLQLNYQLFLFRSRVYFSTPWIWDLLWKWDEAEVIGCQFCAWASRVPGQFVLLSPKKKPRATYWRLRDQQCKEELSQPNQLAVNLAAYLRHPS